jgi:selenocysteine lyase/cysteine desulfurase
LGPEGLGVLYVAAEHRERLRVIEPGWASVAQREQWDDLRLDYDDSARRFEGGTLNITGALGLGASLDLLTGAAGGRGVEAIWEHVDGLAARLTQGLTEVGATVLSDRSPSARSGIVTFAVDGRSPESVVETLAAAGVVASPRGGGTRLSPHGYTTDDEVDTVIDLVRRTSA